MGRWRRGAANTDFAREAARSLLVGFIQQVLLLLSFVVLAILE